MLEHNSRSSPPELNAFQTQNVCGTVGQRMGDPCCDSDSNLSPSSEYGASSDFIAS